MPDDQYPDPAKPDAASIVSADALSQLPSPPTQTTRHSRWRALRTPSTSLSLFGRAVAILLLELFVNAALWVIAALLWAPHAGTRQVLSLAVIAWTLGLRHAVDADHICAIDNSIRRLVASGQQPVTVGTFFSLGHSTVVIVATLVVIVSADLADKVADFGKVGGYIGVCISASFLFLIAVINAILLHRTLQARRRLRRDGATSEQDAHGTLSGGWISKMAYPLFKLIDAPWKLLPLGMLFGLGFDTASSILLLSVSATASSALRDRPGELILLPLLFTAGMTAIDTIDGVVMVYAYSVDALPEKKWRLFNEDSASGTELAVDRPDVDRLRRGKTESLMDVSIFLTAVSIAVALLVSIIEFMGLAADQLDGGERPGVEGSWWRFWLTLNDGSGWLGIAIIGFLVCSLIVWLGWLQWRGRRERRSKRVSVHALGEHS